MPQHQYIEDIVAAAKARQLEVVRNVNDNATLITIPAQPEYVVEVLVPDSVLEWSITLKSKRTGEEVYSDWCDHYQVERETMDELEQEMRDSVIGLIDAVNQRELRLRRRLVLIRVLEVRTGESDEWQDVWKAAWPE